MIAISFLENSFAGGEKDFNRRWGYDIENLEDTEWSLRFTYLGMLQYLLPSLKVPRNYSISVILKPYPKYNRASD